MSGQERVKIVLDADVIIHFIRGGAFALLPRILPNYSFVILEWIYNSELFNMHGGMISNVIAHLESLSIEKWEPKGKARTEFMELEKKFGIGESLAMVYCKYNHNVLASSNLKDIKKYCTDNGITYVTTMDLLYIAWTKQLMTEKECDEFISDVIRKGSKLPVRRIKDYKSRGIVL